MKRVYTINTDASFDHKTQTAAYAYWIKGDDFHVKASGVLPVKVPSSHVAELLAFEKAIRRLDSVVMDRKDTRIIANTDSMWTIHAMTGILKKSKHLTLIKAVRASARDYEFDFRHVKAHTHTADPRHWVNDWCDRMAKLALRTELKNG